MRREVAVRKLQKQKVECLEEWVDFSGVAEAYDMAIEALKQPEIIRCKDCQHYVYGEDEAQYYCHQTGIGTEDDFYCAYGERRADECNHKM